MKWKVLRSTHDWITARGCQWERRQHLTALGTNFAFAPFEQFLDAHPGIGRGTLWQETALCAHGPQLLVIETEDVRRGIVLE